MQARSGQAVAGLLIVAALAGCGVRRDLKPQASQALPVAPFGRADQPSSADLLKPTTQAVPACTEASLTQVPMAANSRVM